MESGVGRAFGRTKTMGFLSESLLTMEVNRYWWMLKMKEDLQGLGMAIIS
jgi:hypothetical protein